MFKEFKEFAMRGNMLDLAVGIIMGAAFGSVVNSLVNDVIMPPIGSMISGIDFKSLYISLNGQAYGSAEEAKKVGAPVIAYGMFLNNIINLLIVSFVVFLLVKQVNRLKKPVDAPQAPSTKECPFCASSIPLKASRCGFCTSQLA